MDNFKLPARSARAYRRVLKGELRSNMKQIDFARGSIFKCILKSAVPMLAAQVLNLLYNIVDRIYIARIPAVGTDAIGAVGLCFPVIIIITAFTNLYGSGGAPLYSMAYGRGEIQKAGKLMNLSFYLELLTGFVLMIFCELFCEPLLMAFGASSVTLSFASSYLRIYLIGTLFSMIAGGMNPFINAQGFPVIGMVSVGVGAICNIVLDPFFIFFLKLGINGAAIATVISQFISAVIVMIFLLSPRAMSRLGRMTLKEFLQSGADIVSIVSLGAAAFVMQITNSLVSISCNRVLSQTGGDAYVSVMTIISSVRQLLDTPIFAISEGTSPVMSFNYGAGEPERVRRAIYIMTALCFSYTFLAWGLVLARGDLVIAIFSSDREILKDALPALNVYFFAFVFQTFQYAGQAVFKSLGKRKQAIFFSLLRKAVIVIPLTYLLPYGFHMGTRGVFMAEPISNVIGGLACYITMMLIVFPELRRKKSAK